MNANKLSEAIVENSIRRTRGQPFLAAFERGEIKDLQVIQNWASRRYVLSLRFPRLLEYLIAICNGKDNKLAEELRRNLADEQKPIPHREMFRNFLRSIGVNLDALTPEFLWNFMFYYPANVIGYAGREPVHVATAMLAIETLIGFECIMIENGFRVAGISADLEFFTFHGVQDLDDHSAFFVNFVDACATEERAKRRLLGIAETMARIKLELYDNLAKEAAAKHSI